MSGRKKKVYSPIYREIIIGMENQTRVLLATILILCPICGSNQIGTFGTHKRLNNRVEYFQCKDPACTFLKKHKGGKQFCLTTSKQFQQEAQLKLQDLFDDLFLDNAKYPVIAKKYHITEPEISLLRSAFEEVLQDHHKLDSPIDVPQKEVAVALDETFMTIEGKTIYTIIATGYTSRKTLAIKVSETRNEIDMKEVFDNAEKNTTEPFKVATSDAWSATISTCKNLNRDFTHIIHPHKKPYDKAIIKRYTYEDGNRITTTIGVKTNVFKRKGTREFRYDTGSEPLAPPQKKPRGHPLGTKNRQNPKPKHKKQKRGRKGLFKIFTNGKKRYMKVDPYRKVLKISSVCPATVPTALGQALDIFARMSIQNNLSENINSSIEPTTRLKGPKTLGSTQQRISASVKLKNVPDLIRTMILPRRMRVNFVLDNENLKDLDRLCKKGWRIRCEEKKDNYFN
jgi:hypothetical protein